MSAYNEDEGNAPAYQISAVTCTDVSSKPSFTALRKPTVSNFQSSNHSSLNSELTTKESYSWNPEKMKNAYKVKQSYFNQIDIFQNNEDLLREKSEVIMGRIRETLQQHAAEESDKDNNDDDDDETEPTSFFQTDVPEESLERARHRNLVLGEEFNYGPLDMRTIVNTKVVEHYKRGIGLADRGKFEQAIVCFTRALNLRPAEVQCYIERAECHLQLCDLRSAYLNYKKAYSLEPDDQLIRDKLAFVAYLEGQCLFDQRLYSDALKRFATATRMKPDNTSYNMRAIACLAALGKSDDCLALVSRHIEAGRSNKNWANAQLFVLRARLHLQFNNTSLAYYDVQDALRVDPILPQALKLLEEMRDKSENYKNQAVTLALELRFGEAISKMNLAIESDPSRAHLHIYRASLHRKVNNFNEAIDDLLLALDKCKHGESDDDEDEEADNSKEDYEQAQRQLLVTYNDFSVYCYKRGFYDEAVVLLNKAIKGEKNEVGLYLNRGDCFFKLNNLDFALADYEQALELDESLWSCRCRIAIVYNEQGIIAYHQKEYEKGVMKFNEAVSNNPKVGQFYIHRARCFYVLQAFQHARDDLLMAMLLDPHNIEIVPFLSRLFPGRSVREIMDSGLMEASRRRLDNLMRVNTTTPRKDDRELKITSKKVVSVNPSLETLPFQDVSKMKTSKSEELSCLDLIHEKKKNRKKVEELLKKPLNCQRRPPIVSTVSRSAVTKATQNSKPYKWKQFV